MVEDGKLVKFPFATCLLHLQLLLQVSFHQEEVKQPHCQDKNTARQISGEVVGTPKDQLCHLLYHLQDKHQLLGAHEEGSSSSDLQVSRAGL